MYYVGFEWQRSNEWRDKIFIFSVFPSPHMHTQCTYYFWLFPLLYFLLYLMYYYFANKYIEINQFTCRLCFMDIYVWSRKEKRVFYRTFATYIFYQSFFIDFQVERFSLLLMRVVGDVSDGRKWQNSGPFYRLIFTSIFDKKKMKLFWEKTYTTGTILLW